MSSTPPRNYLIQYLLSGEVDCEGCAFLGIEGYGVAVGGFDFDGASLEVGDGGVGDVFVCYRDFVA